MSRPYMGVADLRLIQRLVARSYASTGLRVGDVAWLSRYHTHRELAYASRLWEDHAGQLVGWIYFRSRGGFNLFVAPGHADDALLDQMMGGIEEIAATSEAAFAPSDLVVAQYERVQARWPYRPELDRIVLTGHGDVVAFCTAWIDEENGAGLLEPVGTHPAHQRRGLARAVCLDALRALHGAGARTAQVGFGSAAGQGTYQSIGFELSAADTVYCRDPR